METVSIALLALLSSLISACDRKAEPPDENKAGPVKEGNLLIDSKLSRDGTPYSFQEDVYLIVTVKNLSDSAIEIPHLPAHPATWTLKNMAGGGEVSRPFRPAPTPGLPRNLELPEVSLGIRSEHVYRLPIHEYLGSIPPGRYSIRYRIDSSWTSFESPWHYFEIGPAKQAGFSASVSNPDHAHTHLISWMDKGLNPHRILVKKTPIRDNRNRPPVTRVIASVDQASAPVVSTAYSEASPVLPWIAWLTQDTLFLADVDREDTPPIATSRVPEPGEWTLLEFLVASGTGNRSVTGCMIKVEGGTGTLLPFYWDGGPEPKWLPALGLESPGAIKPMLRPLPGGLTMASWLRNNGGRFQLGVETIRPGTGFNGKRAMIDLPKEVSDPVGFEVKAGANGVHWAVLSIFGGRPAGKYRVHSGKLDPASMASTQTASQSWVTRGMESMATASLALDIHGSPWVMGVGAEGVRIQAKDWKSSTLAKSVARVESGRLFFRRGDLPLALLFNPETGFTLAGVTYPDGSNSSPDKVEDYE